MFRSLPLKWAYPNGDDNPCFSAIQLAAWELSKPAPLHPSRTVHAIMHDLYPILSCMQADSYWSQNSGFAKKVNPDSLWSHWVWSIPLICGSLLAHGQVQASFGRLFFRPTSQQIGVACIGKGAIELKRPSRIAYFSDFHGVRLWKLECRLGLQIVQGLPCRRLGHESSVPPMH